MDSFRVKAEDTTVLEKSHIVGELQQDSAEMEMFPVLIDGQIGYFHDVDGGYSCDGYHVVNLIHNVQGPDSPPNKVHADNIELHLDEYFYNLDVEDIWEMTQTASGLTGEDEYPQGDYVLSLKVSDYKMGAYSFSEAMSEPIDKRHQEFCHNNE